jgi:hypothetical protein
MLQDRARDHTHYSPGATPIDERASLPSEGVAQG